MRTAEVHRFNLMKKLEAKNLMELTNKAKEYKLIINKILNHFSFNFLVVNFTKFLK